MKFVDREPEIERLNRIADHAEGGLAVVFGRRRVGKTRLLLEWARERQGVYTVADQSSADLQRRYFAQAIVARVPGFADVEYGDWRSLLSRLARDAKAAGFRGPIVLDEFPYLVLAAPELPSVLQQWVDHEAREARLVVAVAGSSQRMMQGLVLSRESPLFGRARQVLAIGPLGPGWLATALGLSDPVETVEHWTAWGGIPRYGELAAAEPGPVSRRVERLVLDPLGTLHREPERLLLEEVPPAVEQRPLLDAIGGGAHRMSEIGVRIGRPSTALSHPLARLVEMGLVRREVPFDEPDRGGKRSLYRLDDRFLALWFRVVAPYRAQLTSGDSRARLQLLSNHWPALAGSAWEELVRAAIPGQGTSSALGALGPWSPARRWWRRNQPEWDIVSRTLDGGALLLAEARFGRRPFSQPALARAGRELLSRPAPQELVGRSRVVRALCVPAVASGVHLDGVTLLTGREILPAWNV